jgi:hypothetical protein
MEEGRKPVTEGSTSLADDLAGAVRSAVTTEASGPSPAVLAFLEEEHRVLSERRRRLHESIDLLEGLDNVKPDAAARLERYKSTESEVSRQRRDLYRRISQLRVEQLRQSGGSTSLLPE